jgi:hypothetical protein
MVIVFMLYTWPWGFCCFWLLSTLHFADEDGRISGSDAESAWPPRS